MVGLTPLDEQSVGFVWLYFITTKLLTMVQEILHLISAIDTVEDMDIVAYHVKRRHELLAKQDKAAKLLKSFQ